MKKKFLKNNRKCWQAGACRGVVLAEVTPDLTAPPYFEVPQNYRKLFSYANYPLLLSYFFLTAPGKFFSAPGKMRKLVGR